MLSVQYKTRLATKDDIQQIKELDDLSFGSHQGVSVEELNHVIDNGAVILVFDGDRLVGESQLVTQTFPGSPIFPIDTAYFYGTGVHPDFQGKNIGKLLTAEQEKFAIKKGKTKFLLTIRVENYPSLKLRLSSGFKIIGYDEKYYGLNYPEDARLILVKNLNSKEQIFKACLKIPITFFTSNYDTLAHKKIAQAIKDGLVGYDIDRLGISFTFK